MNCSIWTYKKEKEQTDYRFQVAGIKRGSYTKILDPIFKGCKEVGNGFNYKDSTEVVIFSKSFQTDDEMISWVKNTISFPTIYNKCNAKCTIKILVEDKSEVKDDAKPSRRRVSKNK